MFPEIFFSNTMQNVAQANDCQGTAECLCGN